MIHDTEELNGYCDICDEETDTKLCDFGPPNPNIWELCKICSHSHIGNIHASSHWSSDAKILSKIIAEVTHLILKSIK